MSERISRRSFFQAGLVGVGTAVPLSLLAARIGRAAAHSGDVRQPAVPSAPAEHVDDQTARNQAFERLVAPLTIGTTMNQTTVSALAVGDHGLGVITLTDESGQAWHAEIARRTAEDAALNPIAVSRHYSVYLRNGGSGATPTDEHVARAAMTIANHLKRNEQTAAAPAFASRAEFWKSSGYEQAERRA